MNDLYFLKYIAWAYQQPDLERALKEAFSKISYLGQRSEYKQGFLQFIRFMAEVEGNCERVSRNLEDRVNDMAHELSLQLATGQFQGDEGETEAALNLIISKSDWRKAYELMCGEAEKSERFSVPLEMIVEKNGVLYDSFSLGEMPAHRVLTNVTPGNYLVKLDTGRLIWQERLDRNDLIWVYAFPETGLRLAADTGDSGSLKTREVLVLDGDGTIRVYPGIESGRLELEFRGCAS